MTHSMQEQKLVQAADVKEDQDAMDSAFFSGIWDEFNESDIYKLDKLRERYESSKNMKRHWM